MHHMLLYVGAGLLVFWGGAHLVPTRNVVRGFGDLSVDNRRILVMEWIGEGVTLIFLGGLTAAATAVGLAGIAARVVFGSVFAVLNVLSAVSLLTGFRVRTLPFKLCPVIFSGASVLVLLGGVV